MSDHVPVRTETIRLPGGSACLWLVRAEGTVDTAGHPLFDVMAGPPEDCTAVAVDLSLVPLLSAAGVAGLRRSAARLAEAGRPLLVVGTGSAVLQVLTHGVADVATVSESLRDVIAACTPADAGADASPAKAPPAQPVAVPDTARLQEEVRALRGRLRTYPQIAQAQGILQERYALPPGRVAFDLLRECSQHHNVPIRSLAAQIETTPPPRRGAALWFPHREDRQPPRLGFLDGDARRSTMGEVTRTVLARTLTLTDTERGDVRLVDPVTGALRIQRHQGLSEDFLARSDDGRAPTACRQAVTHARRVTVADNAGDPALGDAERGMLLAEGCRATVSTPLTAGAGRCLGVVSVHSARPWHPPAGAQAATLDEMCGQAGRWLAWYQDIGVLAALESLHQRALQASRNAASAGLR